MQGQAPDKTCLVIFGMHRSGTSLLAKLCNFAGAALPESIIGASDSNQSGHWEPRRMAEYNDEVLEELGQSWDDFRDIDMSPKQERRYVDQLKFLIRDDYKDEPLIVLKEPRASRFVGPTLQALTELGYRICPVHAVRHPIEVARSLESRDEISDRFSGLYWLRYVLEVELGLADQPHKIVTYSDVLAEPEATIRGLFAYFDLEIEDNAFAKNANQFASPDLRHHQVVSWSGAPSYYKDWVRPVYEILRASTDGELSSNDLDRLHKLNDDLSQSSRALHDLRLEVRRHQKEAELFEQELTDATAQLTDVKAQLSEATAHTQKLERDITDTLKANRENEGRDLASIHTLQVDLGKAEATIETLRAEFQSREAFLTQRLEDVIASQQSDLEALHAEIARLESARVPMERELQDTRSKLSQLDQVHSKAIGVIEATFPHMLGVSLDEVHSVSDDVRVERAADYAQRAVIEFETIAENNRLRGERLHRVETELAYAKARSDHFENLTHEIYGSTSWRLTAPLRRFAQLWRNKSRVAFKLLAGERLRDSMRNADLPSALDASRSPAIREARNALMARRSEVLDSGSFLLRDEACSDSALPSLTISAVTYNASRWLEGFFSSLMALDYPLEKVTLHMVDNGSTDDTIDQIKAFQKSRGGQLKDAILSQRPNLGYGMGNDWAIRKSKDDFVLVTNVDVSFYPESLRQCVEFALKDQSEVGCWEFRQTPYEHPKYYDPVTLETNWNAHACVLFRRAAYLDVGGYDPKIFMYGEDVELSYRLRASGYILRYVPEAVIEHYVDLEDTSLRPHQLSGSTAANILLRYRYGSKGDAAAGEALLHAVKRNETDPDRAKAFEDVTEIVSRERWHFWRRCPSKRALRSSGAVFPFNEFDYGVTRQGVDVIRRPFSKADKDLPRVSIITRTHGDSLQHVRNAIASVLNQTYPNIEHIIVEDRTDVAKDYVEALAETVGKDRLRYLKSPGQGRSECGNYGAANATGDWLCWLDNDDLLFADHVETLVRALDYNPEAVASYALAWDAHSEMVDGEPHLTRFELPEAHMRP
ncbi:MAG: glycosyltransferase, partial [Pseudomonadota bacterium]